MTKRFRLGCKAGVLETENESIALFAAMDATRAAVRDVARDVIKAETQANLKATTTVDTHDDQERR